MRYIALLRGINVSGAKLIKMDYLKQLFENMGFGNVVTYIQSGNIVFDSPDSSTNNLQVAIEEHLGNALGYVVPVFVRSKEQWEAIIHENPFTEIPEDIPNSMNVTFLQEYPSEDKLHKLISSHGKSIQIHSNRPEIYSLLLTDQDGNKLYPNVVIEKNLKSPATTRNWATVNKLAQL